MKANPTKTDRAARPKTAHPAHHGENGNMTPKEIRPLVWIARRAFDRQAEAGLVDSDFDTWRHDQIQAAVGKPGLKACSHADFRPIMAHFQILAGDDEKALANLLKSGPARDHSAPGDTHEHRRQLAHLIGLEIDSHLRLANTSEAGHLAALAAEWMAENPCRPFPGADPHWLADLRARKAAVEAGGGPIGVGYLVYVTRQKTRRPDLTLGDDWRAGLADRCTAGQLGQILSTLRNRIAAREGRGTTGGRNSAQRKTRPSVA